MKGNIFYTFIFNKKYLTHPKTDLFWTQHELNESPLWFSQNKSSIHRLKCFFTHCWCWTLFLSHPHLQCLLVLRDIVLIRTAVNHLHTVSPVIKLTLIFFPCFEPKRYSNCWMMSWGWFFGPPITSVQIGTKLYEDDKVIISPCCCLRTTWASPGRMRKLSQWGLFFYLLILLAIWAVIRTGAL